MRIRDKITIGFIASGIVLGSGMYFGGHFLVSKTTDEYVRLIKENIPIVKVLGDLKIATLRVVASTTEYAFLKASAAANIGMEHDSEEKEKMLYDMGVTSLDLTIAKLQLLINKGVASELQDRQVFVSNLANLAQDLNAKATQILELSKKGRSIALLAAKDDFEEVEDKIIIEINSAIQHEDNLLKQNQEALARFLTQTHDRLMGLGGIYLLLSFIYGLLIQNLSQHLL